MNYWSHLSTLFAVVKCLEQIWIIWSKNSCEVKCKLQGPRANIVMFSWLLVVLTNSFKRIHCPHKRVSLLAMGFKIFLLIVDLYFFPFPVVPAIVERLGDSKQQVWTFLSLLCIVNLWLCISKSTDGMVRAIVCLNLDQLTQASWLGLFFLALALAPDIFSLTQPFLIYKYHSWLALAEWPSFPFLLKSQDLIFNSLSLLVYILWQITQENLVLNQDVILEHFNPWEWSVTISPISIIPKQTHWGYKDKGNDHQLKKLLIVKQILLVSTIKNV